MDDPWPPNYEGITPDLIQSVTESDDLFTLADEWDVSFDGCQSNIEMQDRLIYEYKRRQGEMKGLQTVSMTNFYG